MNKRKTIIITIIFAIIAIVGALIYQIYTAIDRSGKIPVEVAAAPNDAKITFKDKKTKAEYAAKNGTNYAAARQKLTPPPNHGILSLSSSCRNQIKLANGRKSTWINTIKLKVLLASKSAKLAKNSPKNIQ